MAHEKPKLMTQKEAAEYLGTTVGTLNSWRYYQRYDLPFVRWGCSIRFIKEDLDKWLESRKVNKPEGDNNG